MRHALQHSTANTAQHSTSWHRAARCTATHHPKCFAQLRGTQPCLNAIKQQQQQQQPLHRHTSHLRFFYQQASQLAEAQPHRTFVGSEGATQVCATHDLSRIRSPTLTGRWKVTCSTSTAAGHEKLCLLSCLSKQGCWTAQQALSVSDTTVCRGGPLAQAQTVTSEQHGQEDRLKERQVASQRTSLWSRARKQIGGGVCQLKGTPAKQEQEHEHE